MPIRVEQYISHCKGGITDYSKELTLMVSNLLCFLEDVKTDMKPVAFQEDQIQILMKMKIMKGRDEKEVRELFDFLFDGERGEKEMGGIHNLVPWVVYVSVLS